MHFADQQHEQQRSQADMFARFEAMSAQQHEQQRSQADMFARFEAMSAQRRSAASEYQWATKACGAGAHPRLLNPHSPLSCPLRNAVPRCHGV